MTPKQEAFCLAYLETGNASEAYRRSYDASRMNDASINRKAKELLDNVKITARVAELRAPVVKKAQLTLENHLEDLKKLRNAAVNDKKWSAAIQAEIARGKASGLYVEHHEVSGPDGEPIQQQVQGGVHEETVRAIVSELRGEFLGGDTAAGD